MTTAIVLLLAIIGAGSAFDSRDVLLVSSGKNNTYKVHSGGYARKITNEEHNGNNHKYINSGEWHCGSDWSEWLAKFSNGCWENHYEVNMCCAVHDDCYSYGIDGKQARCDQEFCGCLEKSRNNSIYNCLTISPWTSVSCEAVKLFGRGHYGNPSTGNSKIIKSNIPALNKTVETNYKELYEICTDMNTTLSTCAYNHMLCYMRLLNDNIPQNYEDCVDNLISCLDGSIRFLSVKNEKCLAQLDVTIQSIAENSKVSGIPITREAVIPKSSAKRSSATRNIENGST
ncbi:unnamed protein product [Caenorhabditis brenneri]